MPYAVEMDLDLTAAARVESIVCNIEAECGSDTVTIRSLGATAHVSLAVYDYIAVEAFLPRLKSFAARTACEHILLSSIGIFPVAPASNVFLAPAVTSGLLALHSVYHASFRWADAACWDHYRHNNWVPHVTVAMDLPLASVPSAVAVASREWTPIRARLVALRLVEFRPLLTLGRWEFQRARTAAT